MKKVAIIGYGKSGKGAEHLLRASGYDSFDLYDDKIDGLTPLNMFTGGYELTVMSPGIAFSKLNTVPEKYTSEAELAYEKMGPAAKIIAITGTNGKSTVTFLTAQILQKMGIKAVACGNIGYPVSEAVLNEEPDSVFVVELSSFQAELLNRYEIAACAITNLTPDHLDRYTDTEEYYAAKLRLLDFIEHGGVLVSAPDTHVVNRAISGNYKVQYIDTELRAWPKINGHIINFGNYFADLSFYKLFGKHNIINLAFALSLANSIKPLSGDVTDLIKDLEGMPHRAERVAEIEGITWINDSKATNVDSTFTALNSCSYPTILMLGGRDKKGHFEDLADEINRCCSLICLFGEAAPLIESQLKGVIKVPMITSGALREAVECAAKFAPKNEQATVILSPGCASFDEFSGFEERGRKFVEYVKDVYFKKYR